MTKKQLHHRNTHTQKHEIKHACGDTDTQATQRHAHTNILDKGCIHKNNAHTDKHRRTNTDTHTHIHTHIHIHTRKH